ncbi:MAG: efflux RND transporter permease subunit [Polyangiales bacterium]
MIDGILRFSLAHRALVVAAGLAFVLLAANELSSMRLDVLPDLGAPRISIVTEAPGLAPTEVEQLVTYPLEVALAGTSGARIVRSASAPGLSVVWVDLHVDVDPIVARQRVIERLRGATLPPEALPPIVIPPSNLVGEIAFLAIAPTNDSVDPTTLRRVAERDVRRTLLGVPGVAIVNAMGGGEKEYRVVLDPERLTRFELTAQEVAEALEVGATNPPGGYLVDGGRESIVRVLGRARNADELSAFVVGAREGVPVRIADVGEVLVGSAPTRGSAGANGRSAVLLNVIKQPEADTLATSAAIDEALESLGPALEAQGIAVVPDTYRQESFVRRAVENLVEILRDGAILVVLVLFLFLWNPGAAFTSALAIPISLLAATAALHLMGFGLDAMTLGGLAIAIGELVDDAIVDVENVVRRLRERARLPEDERPPILETVLHASIEIRSSIVSATAVLALVFVPLLFLPGFEGVLLGPLAIAYLVAVGASLLVAITITPVVASYVLPGRAATASEPPIAHRLERAYAPFLSWSMAHPRLLAGLTALLFALGGLGLATAGRGFLPELQEGALNVSILTPTGTPLRESDALGQRAEEALLADPAVLSTARRTGRAERDEHVLGVEASQIELLLRDDERPQEEVVRDLRARLADVPGATFAIGQPISHRIDHVISGHTAALTVKLVGDDLPSLRRAAADVITALRGVPRLVDVMSEPITEVPTLLVDVDADAAGRHGLSRAEAARLASLVVWGREVGRIYEDGLYTPVVVRYGDGPRTDRDALAQAMVPVGDGRAVPLEELANLTRTHEPAFVMRDGARRRLVVTANVEGSDLGAVLDGVREALASVRFPPGVRPELEGRVVEQESSGTRLALLVALVLLAIAVVVGSTLGDVKRTLVVLTNVPLALAGGVVGVWIAGGTLDLATGIGFLTLFGLATRNGILLATRTRDLEEHGVPREEAVRRAALERLSPITMTVLTAALGLVPLAAALGQPGAELQAPMAWVILTGLGTSTFLSMLVVPAWLART